MKLLKAIVRPERVENVVAGLRQAGVPRLTISHVQAIGSGVDPEHYRLSLETGAAYTEKVKIELLCQSDAVGTLIELICNEARTGHRGDGIVAVLDVERCVKVRTGEESELALL